MKFKEYTYKDFMAKSMYEIIHELIDLGAPIKLKSITKCVNLTMDDIEVLGNFECHPDRLGGVTYLWGEGDWFE